MTIRLLAGDCRDVLATLPAGSVHCVVTSPPYFGLRDYGTAQWDGGDAGCGHVAGNARNDVTPERLAERAAQYGTGTGAGSKVTAMQYRDTCGKCGARRVDRQIGLEATPDEYLATMVAVFREVKRALRPDGTCWVNMGDSYSTSFFSHDSVRSVPQPMGDWSKEGQRLPKGERSKRGAADSLGGLKSKDLMLMPARLALALQADGWWVRSDIIWHKPNPMPESCTDRPTSAHEHVFLLTRSARYFFDNEAIREPTGNEMSADEYAAAVRGYPGRSNDMQDFGGGWGRKGFLSATPPGGRSCRNVWTIATSPFSAAHFATFPPELASRCIRAGTSERGVCAQCGAPWRRVTERVNGNAGASWHNHLADQERGQRGGASAYRGAERKAYEANGVTTTGWSPSCTHDAPVVPATVLDPFFGAGTTGLVADRLGRDCIGIDLNPDYNAMSRARITDDAPLFAQFPVADPADERMADLFADDEYQRPGKSQTTPRHDGNRWNENNGRGFKPRMPLAAD